MAVRQAIFREPASPDELIRFQVFPSNGADLWALVKQIVMSNTGLAVSSVVPELDVIAGVFTLDVKELDRAKDFLASMANTSGYSVTQWVEVWSKPQGIGLQNSFSMIALGVRARLTGDFIPFVDVTYLVSLGEWSPVLRHPVKTEWVDVAPRVQISQDPTYTDPAKARIRVRWMLDH